jgi:hypothetical protein
MAKQSAADQPHPETQRGAKPLQVVAIQGDVMDGDKLAVRHGELVQLNKEQQALVDQFGDGLPYVREIYIAESQRDMRTAAEAAVRVGRRLIVMKAHEPRGEWMSSLSQLGIGQDTAERMMAAARRLEALPNSAPARNLIEATKSQSKLFELLSLPEDQFKELAAEGETEGLALDDLAGMTRNDLRDAIREIKADLAAKDERISKLSDQVNKAEEKAAKAARKWKTGTPDDQQITLEQRVIEGKHEVLAALGGEKSGLAIALMELADHCNTHGLDCSQFMGDAIGELMGALRIVRDGFNYGFDVPVVNDAGA